MSRKYSRYDRLFWEKKQKSINSKYINSIGAKFIEHTVPRIAAIIDEHPELLFQQDNASLYKAKAVQQALEESRVIPIIWPANSLDLNPIKALQNDIKEYIQKNYLELHQSYKRLKEIVQEAQESISIERVRELVNTMEERIIDVIVADRWCTPQ